MPTYTDPVFIDGGQDDPQLRVQGHTTQTDQLQTWENSAGTTLAQVTNDGRLEVGNNAVGGVSAALIEANQGGIVAGSAVKQGIQSRGVVNGAISESLAWSIHELEFGGSGVISSNQAALRTQLTHNNSGSGTTTEMRAGDFEVKNQQDLNRAVGVRSAITNTTGKTITEAAAFEVVPPNAGTIGTLYGLNIPDLPASFATKRYAIRSRQGLVRFDDALGIGTDPSTSPSAKLHVAQEASVLNMLLENGLNGSDGPKLWFRRARTSLTNKQSVQQYDYTGRLVFEGWDGSAYQTMALIDAFVDGTPGGNNMPGALLFRTRPVGDGAIITERMRISPNGYVGIGTTSPAYLLDVAGAAHASSFPTSSDQRLKKNVHPLETPLEKLLKLNGVRFQWNAVYESTGRGKEDEWQIGVIAQEVEAQFPDLVSRWHDKENDTEFLAVDYNRMAAVFIEAIKAQQIQIEKLKAQVEALEEKTDKS